MPRFFRQDLLSSSHPVTSSQPDDPAKTEEQVIETTIKQELQENPLTALIDDLNSQKEIESPLDTPELSPPSANFVPQPPMPEYQAPPSTQVPVSQPMPTPMVGPIKNDDGDLTQILLSWKAPDRPYRKKDRSFYTTVAILVVLISLIALLAGELMLIGVVLALGFLVYILNFIPPLEIDYKISKQGVTISNHFYHWQQLDSFWFSQKDGFKILHILTQIRFPSMLIMVIQDVSEEEVKKVCAKYLPYHEIPPKSLMDNWAEKLQKHFPLENPHKNQV